MYYVYRYLNDEEIIYIGITNNLVNRYRQHRRDSIWFSEEYTYQYIKVDNKFIAKIFETYLINRDSPIGNGSENNQNDASKISFDIKEDWTNFNINYSALAGKKETVKSNKKETINREFIKYYDENKLYLPKYMSIDTPTCVR